MKRCVMAGVLSVLLMTVCRSNPAHAGCTGGMALGLPAGDQNLIGATLDWNSPMKLPMLTAKLVTDGTHRYLRVAFGGQPGDGAWLNDTGVGYKDFSRIISSEFLGDSASDQETVSDQLMKTSDSAQSFVDAWTPTLAVSGCGQPREVGSGWALLVVDNSEGYLIEAGDVNDRGAAKHLYAVFGPMKNTIFAHANYYLDQTLRGYQQTFPGSQVGGMGYERARRMWNMLAQKQYYGITAGGGAGMITVPFFADVLRSRGTEAPSSGRIWDQKPLDDASKTQGGDAICKNVGTSLESIGLTYCGQIIKPSKEQPALLSCVWSGLGFPLTSPFLPFYIGVNDLPDRLERGDQPGDFAYVFDQLYQCIYSLSIAGGQPVFSVNVARLRMVTAGCRAFDYETYRQSLGIESQTAALAAQGRESEARKLLTDFLNARTIAAIDAANICLERWGR